MRRTRTLPVACSCFLVQLLAVHSEENAFGKQADSRPSMEDLAYEAGTSKSHDDQKYVDVYAALFEPHRDTTSNVTEIGVAAGQSLDLWQRYFPKAHIWGFDIRIHPKVEAFFRSMDRVHFIEADCYGPVVLADFGIADESMDIVIDDAGHTPGMQEKALETFWRLVKPGGYYIMEDVMFDKATQKMHIIDGKVNPNTQKILEENFAFFVDTGLGHRNFTALTKLAPRHVSQIWDRFNHNLHLAVIQKRVHNSRPRPFLLHMGKDAMVRDGFLLDTGANTNRRHHPRGFVK